MSKKYTVQIFHESHFYDVEAENEEEADEKAMDKWQEEKHIATISETVVREVGEF